MSGLGHLLEQLRFRKHKAKAFAPRAGVQSSGMAELIDLTGQRFSHWTVIRLRGPGDPVDTTKTRRLSWLCRCDCEAKTERWIASFHLRGEGSTHCGCSDPRRTHGLCGTTIYNTWAMLRDRCVNPNAQEFHNYGARGIRCCERWNKFENFLADMGPTWKKGLSIDRINNDGDYSPENCRWATRLEQCNNTRSNVICFYKGTPMTLAQAAREGGVNYQSFLSCVRHRGLTVEAAIERLPKKSDTEASA